MKNQERQDEKLCEIEGRNKVVHQEALDITFGKGKVLG